MTIFEDRIAAAIRFGRNAADENPDVPADIALADLGYDQVSILLTVTGEKSLADPEEQEDILSAFEDAFYDRLEELR